MNDTTSAVESLSVGELLRNARVTAGLTVLDVANKLNLTVSVVESLEQNKFAQLPGTTFTRGYIRSYAKLLHLDATQLVQIFDQQAGAAVDISAVHSIDQVGESRRVSRGMLQFSLFILFLLVIAAAYYGWQSRQAVTKPVAQSTPAFERVEVERADGSVHVQTLDELEDQAVALALENHTADLAVEALASPTGEVLVAAEDEQLLSEQLPVSAEQQQPTQAVDTPESVAAEPAELIEGMGVAQLTFIHDCWLRIVDADGAQVANGLKRAGEQLTVSGKAPLDVHLGYAKGVSIRYNGEAVDFSAAISGETARIKLGQ